MNAQLENAAQSREHLAAIESQTLTIEQNPDDTDAFRTMSRVFVDRSESLSGVNHPVAYCRPAKYRKGTAAQLRCGMTQIEVGISDCCVSADASATLVTYALGAGIAVNVYEPVRKVGGMLHFMLPESSLDRGKAQENPNMFADTGIPLLYEKIRASGAAGNKVKVRLAGGAQALDPRNVFAIGKRNYLAAKKALWKLGLFVESEAVGSDFPRSVWLDLSTGKSWLREGGKAEGEFRARGANL